MTHKAKGISLGLKTADFSMYLGEQTKDTEPYWEMNVFGSTFRIYDHKGILWFHESNDPKTNKGNIVNKLKTCNRLDKNIRIEVDVECLQKILKLLRKKQIIETKTDNTVLLKTFAKDVSKPFTFGDLFNHLKTHIFKYKTIHDFMNTFSLSVQHRFEPQESVFRLFAFLNLITYEHNGTDLLKQFRITTKNFSKGEVNDQNSDIDVEILHNMHLKDSGDVSDLTFVKEGSIIASSSKNYADYSSKGKKLDLAKIEAIHNKHYSGKELNILLVVRNKPELEHSHHNMSFSSKKAKDLIQKALKLDWDDLNKAYQRFKTDMSLKVWEFEEYLKSVKSDYFPLHLRLYLAHNYRTKDNIHDIRFYQLEKISWTYEDEQHCANILDESSFKYLKNKCGPILDEYSLSEIATHYISMPKLNLIILKDGYNSQFLPAIFNIVHETSSVSGQSAVTHVLKTPLLTQLIQNNNFYGYSLYSIQIIVENMAMKRTIQNFINNNLQYTFPHVKVSIVTIDKLKNLTSYDTLIFVNLTHPIENDIVQAIISSNKKNTMYNLISTSTTVLQTEGKIHKIPTFMTTTNHIRNNHLLFDTN